MPRHQVRRLTAAVVAAAVLVLAACGDEDTADFVRDSNRVTSEISAIGRDIGTAVSGAGDQTDAELERQFAALAGRVGDVRTRLDDLDGPTDTIADTIVSLSDALAEGQKDLKDISEAAGAGDAAAARTATEALVADSPAISTYNRRLKTQTADLQRDR